MKRQRRKNSSAFLQVGGDSFDPRASFEVTDDGTLRTGLFSISSTGFKRNQGGGEEKEVEGSPILSGHARGNSLSSPGLSQAALGEFNSATLLELGILGRGAGGRVVKALHKPSLNVVALKCIDVHDRAKRGQLAKELKELDADYCPNIVSFYSAFYESGAVKLALEYMNRGALQSFIDKKCRVSELVLSSMAKQALIGLAHLHRSHKVHRDIKPGNILLHHTGIVKLSDFGIVAELRDDAQKCDTFVGTMIFMSPERLASSGYGYPADIWSLGMTIITLATAAFPMSTAAGYWGMLTELNKNPPPALGSDFSTEIRDFVARMLQKAPQDRWTAAQLLEHPFIVNGPEIEEALAEYPRSWRMMQPDPALVERLRQRRHLKILKFQHLQRLEDKKQKKLINEAAMRKRRPSISAGLGKISHVRRKSVSQEMPGDQQNSSIIQAPTSPARRSPQLNEPANPASASPLLLASQPEPGTPVKVSSLYDPDDSENSQAPVPGSPSALGGRRGSLSRSRRFSADAREILMAAAPLLKQISSTTENTDQQQQQQTTQPETLEEGKSPSEPEKAPEFVDPPVEVPAPPSSLLSAPPVRRFLQPLSPSKARARASPTLVKSPTAKPNKNAATATKAPTARPNSRPLSKSGARPVVPPSPVSSISHLPGRPQNKKFLAPLASAASARPRGDTENKNNKEKQQKKIQKKQENLAPPAATEKPKENEKTSEPAERPLSPAPVPLPVEESRRSAVSTRRSSVSLIVDFGLSDGELGDLEKILRVVASAGGVEDSKAILVQVAHQLGIPIEAVTQEWESIK